MVNTSPLINYDRKSLILIILRNPLRLYTKQATVLWFRQFTTLPFMSGGERYGQQGEEIPGKSNDRVDDAPDAGNLDQPWI